MAVVVLFPIILVESHSLEIMNGKGEPNETNPILVQPEPHMATNYIRPKKHGCIYPDK